MPDTTLQGLLFTEGVIAFYAGLPREALDELSLQWARDAWHAGWDRAADDVQRAKPNRAIG